MAKIKLMIVDDEPKIRKGLLKLLGAREGWQVSGVFEDAHSALTALYDQEADVIVTDIKMPEVSGLELIRQIVSRVNRTVNTASPIVDARLEDGSRVHVVLEPVALNGPILTIRKFPDPITMDRLLEYGSVTREAADLLKTLAAAR